MNEPESIESIDRQRVSDRGNVPDRQRVSDRELGSERELRSERELKTGPPYPRSMGSPLPMGSARRPAGSPVVGNRISAPPPGRALPAKTGGEEPSGVQRAMSAFRTVMPIVQRLLPLLEGNVLTAISNVLTPRQQAPAPPPKVDLAPIESSLAELQTQHRGLREQVIEQNASLKRVEDHLEMVRQATDRNTLEQQELLEDLKLFSRKVKVIAAIGIGVLMVGFALNLLLFLHIQRVLP
jgi:hypothetical protein